MNFTALSFGTGVALVCLLLLSVLPVIFFITQNMFLFFLGAGMIFWCCDTSLVPALKYDGAIGK